ncbi:MAG: hypothetical protein HYS56_05845 [Candidatus Omnitrophica bacterium]|nr:hypothetical protein [Candidatus Omnitrophota bacterium]
MDSINKWGTTVCLRQESEKKMLSDLSGHLDQDPVLRGLWNNEKDAEYDRL